MCAHDKSMPNRYTLETKRCPKNPAFPLGQCPVSRPFVPHPRSVPKPTPSKKDASTSEDPAATVVKPSIFLPVTVEAAPPTVANPSFPVTAEAQRSDDRDSNFRPTGGVKPLKQYQS